MGSTWKLDDKNPKFELLADKKILNLTNKKGEPPISSKKGASIPMFISWIKGKWVIVR
jgi:hypothetical protein